MEVNLTVVTTMLICTAAEIFRAQTVQPAAIDHSAGQAEKCPCTASLNNIFLLRLTGQRPAETGINVLIDYAGCDSQSFRAHIICWFVMFFSGLNSLRYNTLQSRSMKKRNKETDIPDFFSIKKPKITNKQVRNSWDAISKKIGEGQEKDKQECL